MIIVGANLDEGFRNIAKDFDYADFYFNTWFTDGEEENLQNLSNINIQGALVVLDNLPRPCSDVTSNLRRIFGNHIPVEKIEKRVLDDHLTDMLCVLARKMLKDEIDTGRDHRFFLYNVIIIGDNLDDDFSHIEEAVGSVDLNYNVWFTDRDEEKIRNISKRNSNIHGAIILDNLPCDDVKSDLRRVFGKNIPVDIISKRDMEDNNFAVFERLTMKIMDEKVFKKRDLEIICEKITEDDYDNNDDNDLRDLVRKGVENEVNESPKKKLKAEVDDNDVDEEEDDDDNDIGCKYCRLQSSYKNLKRQFQDQRNQIQQLEQALREAKEEQINLHREIVDMTAGQLAKVKEITEITAGQLAKVKELVSSKAK